MHSRMIRTCHIHLRSGGIAMSRFPARSEPIIIQGGMGVAVSGWRLARAVSRNGQSGSCLGDGHRRRDGTTPAGGRRRWTHASCVGRVSLSGHVRARSCSVISCRVANRRQTRLCADSRFCPMQADSAATGADRRRELCRGVSGEGGITRDWSASTIWKRFRLPLCRRCLERCWPAWTMS